MTAKTHILGGILAGEAVCLATSPSPLSTLALLAGAAAGALLPDIDHSGSKISRSCTAGKVVSFIVSALTTHRGVIHTPAFILIVSIALSFASFFSACQISLVLFVGLILGMFSHLVLDTFNPSGIMWLWPLSSKRIHLASIKTGSLLEWFFSATLLLADVYLALRYFPFLSAEIGHLLS